MTTALINKIDDYPITPFGTQLVWEAIVTVSAKQDLGAEPTGHRYIVPITGGSFRGGDGYEAFHGSVMAGGADRQLLRPDGIKELCAIYEMQVHDGTILSIENNVIVDTSVTNGRYAASRIHVTAPAGKWDWLNRRLFLGSLHSVHPNPGHVVIRGWEVTV